MKMYDSTAILLTPSGSTFDSSGNETVTYDQTMVYVMPRSIYHSEFYNAAQAGLHPSLSLYLANRADYEGQKLVIFEGKEYNIIRTDWKGQRDGITLVCEERIA